ncbi:MAG: hypothetical protein JNG88_11915 [Phycisphaerales bacterium]|nr:hypothetical protein [Phycisphaerales bacterium]
MRGTIIQENTERITIALQYGTIKVGRADIESVEKSTPEEPVVASDEPKKLADGSRLPLWSNMIQQLAKAEWAADLTQIPATVIDNGVMESVPYTSFRCGSGANYEINVYGDPDTPAGVEIGVYAALTNDAAAKHRCVDFIASVLPDATDASLLNAARLDEDKIERGGMTIEITPPTAPDAYGGWWVSVYYKDRLDKARASKRELAEITVARSEDNAKTAPKSPSVNTPAPKQPSDAPKTSATSREPNLDWTADDLRRAKSVVSTSSGSGRVYVRGYYRKDGTYVCGHTRRRPR